MSFKALAWVVDQKPSRSADKLILYGLADRHNTENNAAWPSIAWLVEFSGLDRKTVQVGLTRLQDEGFIVDTGEREGSTQRVRVFTFNFNRTEAVTPEQARKSPEKKRSQKRDHSGNGPKNGTLNGPKNGTRNLLVEPIPQKATPSSGSRAKVQTSKTLIPEDFYPAELTPGTQAAEIAGRWSFKELQWQIEQFIDYHTKNGSRFTDWQATWRTWVRNSIKFNGSRNGERFNEEDGGPVNPMVRAGIQREAKRRAERGE